MAKCGTHSLEANNARLKEMDFATSFVFLGFDKQLNIVFWTLQQMSCQESIV